MTETEQVTVREITTRLNDAATLATALMMQIDEGDISAEITRLFNETTLRTRSGLDQARQLDDALDSFSTQLLHQKARIDVALEAVKCRKEALKKQIKAVVESNPEVQFRDSTGTKVYVRSSNPALKMTIETASKTVKHIVPEGLSIPDRFLAVVELYVIDTAAVRDALKAGEELDWAKLEATKSLCGL